MDKTVERSSHNPEPVRPFEFLSFLDFRWDVFCGCILLRPIERLWRSSKYQNYCTFLFVVLHFVCFVGVLSRVFAFGLTGIYIYLIQFSFYSDLVLGEEGNWLKLGDQN